jgi:hypothetical protein
MNDREEAPNPQPTHVTEWQEAGMLEEYSRRTEREQALVRAWMDRAWSTTVLGQMVTGELTSVNYADVVTFTVDIPHGNKILHIEGPFEEFLPAPGEPEVEQARAREQTFITIEEGTGTRPFLVKILLPCARLPGQHSRHATAEEALAEIERMEREEQGRYARITAYRMAKYASSG